MRGFARLQQPARHGDGAASADPDDVQIRRRNPAAGLWLSDEDQGADKTRIQESEIRDLDGGHQRLQGRLLGRPGLQFVQRELERFQEKWSPVRVKKTRQIEILEPPFRFDRNGKGSSHAACEAAY